VVEGRTCTLELESFVPRGNGIPADVRAGVTHWSQWLEGWCVDWEHEGGPLRSGSQVWRGRRGLGRSATHVYERPGRHVALVKVFDVLGGEASLAVRVDVRG
jgi:hypothetical protein